MVNKLVHMMTLSYLLPKKTDDLSKFFTQIEMSACPNNDNTFQTLKDAPIHSCVVLLSFLMQYNHQ